MIKISSDTLKPPKGSIYASIRAYVNYSTIKKMDHEEGISSSHGLTRMLGNMKWSVHSGQEFTDFLSGGNYL